MRSKGFTLIELLATIVILSIILAITIPGIMGIIDGTRKEAFEDSVYGIIKAGEILFSKHLLDDTIEEITFTYTEGLESSIPEGEGLEYNGSKPNHGEVKINKKGEVALAIHNETYCAEKSYDNSEIKISNLSKENCILISLPNGEVCGDSFIDDRDTESYKTVKIGSQCWMAENLRYTDNGCLNNDWESSHNACKKANITELQTYEDYADWLQHEVLYQWEVANTSCPEGWKLPSDAESAELITFLGANAGDQLKSKNWCSGETNCAISGFNALPAGFRYDGNGQINLVGSIGGWWSSSPVLGAWSHMIFGPSDLIIGGESAADGGSSVRCLLGQ